MSRRDEFAADRSASPAPITTRAPAPTPRRLSRRALATLVGASTIGVAAALGYSLSRTHRPAVPQQTVAIGQRAPDALDDAPKDYSDLAQRASAGIGPPPTAAQPIIPLDRTTAPAAAVDNRAAADRQRRRQRSDSARASKLFAGSDLGTRTAPASTELPPHAPEQAGAAESMPTGNADAQDRKAAFVAGGSREPVVNSGRLTAPAGRYVLAAGSTIAAALITGLSSDLPGEVVAQVTENVFDSATGRTLLVPQGARLIGTYDARVSYGQKRALVVWTRMILPDGRSIDLDRMIGTDPAGRSGFADRVNGHTGKLLVAGLLSTLFGVGANLATAGSGDSNDIAFAIRESAGRSVGNAGDKIVSRQLDVQPTITVRPGARVRVLVSRDLLLAPWPGG